MTAGAPGPALPAQARTERAVAPRATATASTGVSVAVQPLVLTSVMPLPTARLGVPYSKQLTWVGGSGAMNWMVASGGLPSGLTLNAATGLVSGTPTTLGTRTFQLFVMHTGGSDAQFGSISVITPETSTITLTAPTASARFGDPSELTAVAGPAPATGTVTFLYASLPGGDPGSTATLSTVPLDENSTATRSLPIPAFGAIQVAVTYSGDTAHPAVTSDPVIVEVSAYAGQVIITEFRQFGPEGSEDSYVELYNAGPAVPMAGFRVHSGSGSTTTLPWYSGTLGTGRSHLVAGLYFPYSPWISPDSWANPLGTDGLQVLAPDIAGTRTDAAGPVTGPHLGAGLPALTGTGTSQFAWVRDERAGRPRNTGDNAADFRLVSNTVGAFDSVQPTLGGASPAGAIDPYQHNAVLQSALLDPGVAANEEPNRTYAPGTPGRLVVRRTITNSAEVQLYSVKLRVTAISAENGAPKPGVITQPVSHANLRIVDGTVTATRSGRTPVVSYLNVDLPAATPPGGGLNSTLTLPLSDGLAPGASINVAVTFAVDTPGTFWFGYNVDAVEDPPSTRIGDAFQLRDRGARPAADQAGVAPGSIVQGVL